METDVAMIKLFVTDLFIGFISDIGITLFTLIIICFINYKLAILTIIIFPFLYIITGYFSKKIRAYTKIYREKATDIFSFFQETFSGIKLTKINSNEHNNSSNLLKFGKVLIEIQIKREFISKIASIILELFSVIIPLLLLFYGAYLVIKNDLTLGLLLAYYAYVGRLFKPFHRLARINITIQNVKVSIDRIQEYFDVERERTLTEGIELLKNDFESIEFKNVSFVYDDNNSKKTILENVNFKIFKNERIAFVGASGSGKSTIFDLMLGFYDILKGEIFINGININKISKKSLRKLFAVVPQNDFFFHSSIKENLQITNRNASDEEMIMACELANIKHFIEQLPEKYNTIIGEKGEMLSGGERQRISIARAFLKKSEILLLDEATSQLDNRLEKSIYVNLNDSYKKTQIIIAHRLTTITDVDKIYVFDKGQIVEEGTHENLLDKEGTYFKLWNSQNKN